MTKMNLKYTILNETNQSNRDHILQNSIYLHSEKKKKQNYTENDKGFVREKGEWEVDYKGAAWENLGEFLFNPD